MGIQYAPLHANEVRLMRPVSRPSDSLSFDVVHESLLSKPRYVALSYTWCSPGDTHGILLNGQHFSIRRNLYDALQQIQCSKLVDQYLWVDAICINQCEDDDALNERSLQIVLMTQIYEQAEKILVWLGIPEDETNNRLAIPLILHAESSSISTPGESKSTSNRTHRCRGLHAHHLASNGQEGVRPARFSDIQSVAWNHLNVEEPLVDSGLGFPRIDDS